MTAPISAALAALPALLALLATSAAAQSPPPPPPPIEDNSFLVEEAFNQGPGVVQHINTFTRARDGSSWAYTFTDEWPLRSVRHQLSVTLPVMGTGSAAGVRSELGMGDVALNYRYQFGGADESAPVRLAAPRLSLLVPTGDAARGFGAGGAAVQMNLPASLELAPALITHWNAGATYTPSARGTDGGRAPTSDYNLGASAIWLARPNLNFMLESIWTSAEEVVGDDATVRERDVAVSPGLRGAINFPSGLQIVPGVGFPLVVGRGRATSAAVFLYLSFEHNF